MGQNEDHSQGDSTSESSEKLPQRGRVEGQYIGDFAEGKIRKLIKKRFEKDPTKKQLLMSDAEEQAVLNCIGDPIIRSLIDEIEAIDD